MPEATTASVGTKLIPIDLGGNNKGAVKVDADVFDYFKIPAPTAGAEEMVTRRRKASSRTIYSGLDDTTPKTVGVKASTWKAPIRAPKGTTGKAVRVPTELKTANGHIRFTTLHFPSGATVGAISNWLFINMTAHKPSYFFHNTNRYSVLKAIGDVNPDETPETTT